MQRTSKTLDSKTKSLSKPSVAFTKSGKSSKISSRTGGTINETKYVLPFAGLSQQLVKSHNAVQDLIDDYAALGKK